MPDLNNPLLHAKTPIFSPGRSHSKLFNLSIINFQYLLENSGQAVHEVIRREKRMVPSSDYPRLKRSMSIKTHAIYK